MSAGYSWTAQFVLLAAAGVWLCWHGGCALFQLCDEGPAFHVSAVACRLGISGVPYFIIGPGSGTGSNTGSGREGTRTSGSEEGQRRKGGRYALSGAQPTAALVQAIQKVLDEQQAGIRCSALERVPAR